MTKNAVKMKLGMSPCNIKKCEKAGTVLRFHPEDRMRPVFLCEKHAIETREGATHLEWK